MRRHRTRLRSRRGFSLIELMITVTMISVVGAAIVGVFNSQQRFSRAATDLGGVRSQLQAVTTVLPAELRNISSSGSDILAMSDSSISVRSTIVVSVVCGFTAPTQIRLVPTGTVPTTLANGTGTTTQLTSITTNPQPGDLAFIWDDGPTAATADDSWRTETGGPYKVTGATETSGACTTPFAPASNALPAWVITLDGSTPVRGTLRVGAAVRITREMRYGLYQSALDGQWYLGYRDAILNTYQYVAGPLLPYASTGTTGLRFRYYDVAGAEITSYATTTGVARIDITARARSTSTSALGGRMSGAKYQEDSLRVGVAVRNRN